MLPRPALLRRRLHTRRRLRAPDRRSGSRKADCGSASAPCQRWSSLSVAASTADDRPDLLEPTRELLEALGVLYVIENVPLAPLVNPVLFCGGAFGLEVIRHRHFEVNFPLMSPGCGHLHGADRRALCSFSYGIGGALRSSGAQTPATPIVGQIPDACGLHWMNRDEAKQSFPPAYTEHIGAYAMAGPCGTGSPLTSTRAGTSYPFSVVEDAA